MELPTYIPLAEAARRYHLDRQALTHAVESGRMKAIQVKGEITVAEEDIRMAAKRKELWRQVESLDGEPIAIGAAREKYNLGAASLYKWIKLGYVRVIEDLRGRGRGRKRTLNEADVAYIALVADERGRQPGKRIITPEFIPPHLIS